VAKVLKDFRCKVTKRVYRSGEEYDGDRTEELQNLGFVEADEGAAGDDPAEKPARKRAKRDDSG
jgi:hypothetical protein